MTESVSRLSETLMQLGHAPEIATVEPSGQLNWTGPVKAHVFPLAHPALLRRSEPFRHFMNANIGRFDLVHVHGIWSWTGLYARLAARRCGIPLIISPRGTLEAWSLKQKWLRKRFGWWFWERTNFRSATLLHATCSEEAESIRRLGLRKPIAVIPNGVAFPPHTLRERDASRRTIFFLSRLHPKKGLDLLVEAWGQIWRAHPDWDLVIAGPDDGGFGASLIARSRDLGIPSHRIAFLGPLYGEAKWRAYQNADLFVLPSHSENFGNVIAEALSQGLPVITTTGTPWQGLETNRCGWWIPTGLPALLSTLDSALTEDPRTLNAMGSRGRAMIEAGFTWTGVASSLVQCYRWALDPSRVRPREIQCD
jgi:glycosyltransferase involved in cell wall biosynthesis